MDEWFEEDVESSWIREVPTFVRVELFAETSTARLCPYKGTARYWSYPTREDIHEDFVWSYPTPHPESVHIAGLVCFYNERVDIEVDEVTQDRP
jgi:uncharacterized protein (DUF427 family)